MANYTIKAPDGNTYSIAGPEGATDEQVRAQVLAQHPTAGAASAPAPPPRGAPVDATGNFGENLAAGVGKAATDMWLGGKQFANWASGGHIGDKAALDKEAADKAELDKQLMQTGGGQMGKYGTDIATAFLPMGAVSKGVALLPKAANIVTRAARAVAPSVATGAAQQALTPDADYNGAAQLGEGAAFGLGGEVIGRGAGRVLRPIQSAIPESVKQQVALLPEKSRLLAENLTNNEYVRSMTNALAQIPVFGAGVKAAREANLGEITKLATGAAGHEVPELTPSAAEALHNRVAGQAERFAAGPDLPVPGMPAALDTASTQADMASRLFGTQKPQSQIASAQRAIAPPPAPAPSGILGPTGAPLPAPTPPPFVPTIPSATAMDVRKQLGDQVFQAQHGVSSQGAEAIKNELENALKAQHGNDFERWLAEHGASLDLRKVQNMEGGLTKAGHVKPEAYVNTLPATEVANPSMPFTKTMTAAADRFASPSLAENRSLMVRMLMGAPLAAGAGAMASGEGIGGGAGTTLGSLALAAGALGTPGGGRYLTGTAKSALGRGLQSEQAKYLARLLGTQAVSDVFK